MKIAWGKDRRRWIWRLGVQREVRFAPINGHRKHDAACPFCADCVEKLENHSARKISQMQRIGDFSRRKAP